MSPYHLLFSILLGLIPLCAMAYLVGRRKAVALRGDQGKLRGHVDDYGWYAIVWLALPALGVSVVATILALAGAWRAPTPMVVATTLAGAGGGLWWAVRRIRPDLRARASVERVIMVLLLAASLVSIFATIGIVISILFEAIKFFKAVSVWEFLTGTHWSPGDSFLQSAGRLGGAQATASFGSVPIFAGTFLITAIAMAVAVPIGLFAAIYMSEYAPHRVRRAVKPMLEILAGIPTVVYGFFAVVTISPLVVELAQTFGLNASFNNALAPGLVMGVMIIPLVSSLSDDVINAVPQSLREGSYALGTTTSETIKKVVLPAALPGIVSAFLLAVSRALGETMIVVMAAGVRPNLTWNPLQDMTTVTVKIVEALTGDKAFDSLETLSAFALGLVLFLVTLTLNVVATIIIRRFRQRYE